jgi:hypothetical protein
MSPSKVSVFFVVPKASLNSSLGSGTSPLAKPFKNRIKLSQPTTDPMNCHAILENIILPFFHKIITTVPYIFWTENN